MQLKSWYAMSTWIGVGTTFDPSAPLWEYINRAHKLMSIENGGRHTYFEERRKKGGGACNGTTRSGYYAELMKKLGLDDPKLVSIINFNNLTVETQRELTKRMLQGMARFLPQISHLPPMAIDMCGLPIHAVKLFWGLCKSSEECKRHGGTIDIGGHL
jgi:hypothetical protein